MYNMETIEMVGEINRVIGYTRVSGGKQMIDNQKFAIMNYCESNNIPTDNIVWVEETISGTKSLDKRKLGDVLKDVSTGDIIICTEISRLGRTMYMVMDVLSQCMDKGCQVRCIKEGFNLQDDLQTKVLAFAFGLAAEIERNLISQRTKEALDKRRAEGVILGRPKGALGKHNKLSGTEETIKTLILRGNSYGSIAKSLNVNRTTLSRFCKSRHLTKEEILM